MTIGKSDRDEAQEPQVDQERRKQVSPVDPPPVLDMSKLVRDLGGDEELALSIAQKSVQPNSERLRMLLQAIQDGNPDMVRAHAHYLKGSALAIGAGVFADLTHRLERAAVDRDVSAIRKLGTSLEPEFQRLLELLRQSIPSSDDPIA